MPHESIRVHFADRLLSACRAKGAPICVGLDPVYERLPASCKPGAAAPASAQQAMEAISQFTRGVLKAVAAHVPCVKFQSACYERYLSPGVAALHQLIEEAQALGLLVILDAKRGDIGASSEHYAAGCLRESHFADLGSHRGPDALTVNSYLGVDGIDPFLAAARAEGKGLFVLVRTSNPGGDALQGLKLADGRTVAEAVAELFAAAGSAAGNVGQSGYSLLGAVVGATKSADAAKLRALMPKQIFLVPGFGAQGGKADDVRACFNKDGRGALITASRSVLYAYEKPATADWPAAIEAAALKMKREIAAILA